MKKPVYVLGMLIAIGVAAQDKKAVKYARTIKAEELKTHLSVLASDEYEGRETGTKGQKMAAEYIANTFKKLGLEAPVNGSHFQTFDLKKTSLNGVYFRMKDRKLENLKDFLYYSKAETYGEESITLVFVGEGNDMSSPSLKGKYVVFSHEEWGSWQEKVDKAKKEGAEGMIVVSKEPQFNLSLARHSSYLKKPSLSLTAESGGNKLIVGNETLVEQLFGKDYDSIKEGEKTKVIFQADLLIEDVETENVLGYLKGSEKPDELLVITAHYDHIGITNGEINNGADDDGSGTVSVLEIAEAFAKAAKKKRKPKRSILFMTVTGEEKGLLGSDYYVKNPVFPLENTVANLNIDMVGRIDDKHKENSDYVYVIGSDKLSRELHDLSEKVNKTYSNLELDYTYNDENDPNRFYYRSDHYNFAKNNIPVIFYFNGTHPDYHKPTDTIEKIAFETMEKRAKLVFFTGWEIANREEKVKLDKKE